MSRRASTLPQRALVTLVRGYRFFISPMTRPSCRFEPSCSVYALQALDCHGAGAGSYLTLRRLARCHPFCAGGHDPVPARAPALFRRGLAEPTPPGNSPPTPTEPTCP